MRLAWGLCLLLVLSAGCSVLLGDDLVFESGETLVENETLNETGYELQTDETREFNRTFSAAGQEVRVVVHHHVAVYQKAQLEGRDGAASGGAVGVITMPDASVAGQSFNPLVRLNRTELIERFVSSEAGSGDFQKTDEYTVEPFGNETTVTVYVSENEQGEPEAYVHLLRQSPPGTSDVVLAHASYPAAFHDTERADVERLFDSLEYRQASSR